MVNIEKWRIYLVLSPVLSMKTEVLLNHNNFYLKYDMPVPMVIIPMVVISMSSLVKKKKFDNTHNKTI